MNDDPAILLLIFNRPALTFKIFEYIKTIKPLRLYIGADGPRAGVESDIQKCEETRKICSEINWNCEVKLLYRNDNLGCGRAVSSAITWFFENEEQGIILEDDCLPNEYFYNYCKNLLAYYKNDNRIMHIGGTNFQKGKTYGSASYYFSAIPHVWGWATWGRAWKHYDFNLSDLNFFLNRNVIKKYVGSGKTHDFWFEIFCKMNQKKIDTWDYQWQYAIWNYNGLAIIPQVNLVQNIGFGIDATHTTDNNPYGEMRTYPLIEIIHPDLISQCVEADKNFFEI